MNPLDFKSFPLHGRRLIEASAGTGKTWTLTALYSRLVVERGVLPSNILVVTFTNAATAELHWRIRDTLSQLITAYEAGSGDDSLSEYFLATVPISDALPRLRAALAGLDDARIHTIHGFCQSILEQYALQMNHWFEYQLSENLFDEVVAWSQDYFRMHCYDDHHDSQLRGEVLGSPGQLVTNVQRLVVNNYPITRMEEVGVASYADLAKEAWIQLNAVWWQERDTLVGYLLESSDLKRNIYKIPKLESEIMDIDKALSTFNILFFKNANFEKFTLTHVAQATKKNAAVFSHSFFECCERYVSVFNTEFPKWQEHIRYEAILDGRRALTRQKHARRLLSFDDLIERMAHAVSMHPELGNEIRRQCPYALIDEFQDTDATQLKIFQSIYPDCNNHNLWLIGDPKQSIYRFRFADIHTYISARNSIPDEACFTLSDNYRSSIGLVTGVNALFETNQNAFKFYPDIMFSPTRASGAGANTYLSMNDHPQRAWTCWVFDADNDKVMNKDVLAQREIKQIAEEICRLLKPGACRIGDRAVKPNDIAIIVRSRQEMTPIAQALKESGVYCAVQSRADIFSSQEALDIVEWLTAMANRHQPDAVRRFMVGPLWGASLSFIDQCDEDSQAFQSVVSILEQWSQMFSAIGCLGVLYKLLDFRQAGARFRADLYGDRKLTNWIHIAELATDYVPIDNGVDDVVNWLLAKVNESGDKEVSDQLQRLESDQNLVMITTIHASKGLEFPIVFLPRLFTLSLNRRVDSSVWTRSYYDKTRQQSCVVVHPKPPACVIESEAHEEAAEVVRQVYVALTRASVKNYLSWGAVREWEKSIFCHLMTEHGSAPDHAAQVLARWQQRAGDHIDILPVVGAVVPFHAMEREHALHPLSALTFTRAIPHGFSVVSYSALAPQEEYARESMARDDALLSAQERLAGDNRDEKTPLDVSLFPKGPHVGNALHALFEWLAACAVWPAVNEIEAVCEKQLRLANIDVSWLAILVEWVQCAWAHVIHEDGWSLASTALADRVVEMEFCVPLNTHAHAILSVLRNFGYDVSHLRAADLQGYLRGFIDLIIMKDDKCYVIDYKTNDLKLQPHDYQGQVLADAIQQHHYQLQYLLYCVALHRYLGRTKPDYDYDIHFGDVRYLFLRGMIPGAAPLSGVYVDRPSRECIEALSHVFKGGSYA